MSPPSHAVSELPHRYVPEHHYSAVQQQCTLDHAGRADRLRQIFTHKARKDVLFELKAYLQQQSEEIGRIHRHHPEGLALAYHLSQIHDQLINEILRDFDQDVSLTIVAIGGYGRAELYPKSDLDLMWLVHNERKLGDKQQTFEKLLYLLWDLGAGVGHSVHSIKSAMKLAESDVVFATALLDARKLCGEESLFQQFITKRNTVFAKSAFQRRFIQAKLRERTERHQQYPDHQFHLEPNLKEGIGTLRDLHIMRWIVLLLDDSLGAVFSGRSTVLFMRCYRQLAHLRMALHMVSSSKKSDALEFDIQQEIAQNLGYRHHQHLLPIMRLMKHFFSTRFYVEVLAEIFIARLADMPKTQKDVRKVYGLKKSILYDFQSLPHDISALLDYFIALSEHGHRASAEAIETVWNVRYLASQAREDPEALLRVRRLITAKNGAGMYALQLLARLGILGRLMPEFSRIHGLGQWDGHHAYSVGQHTFRVIEHLHQAYRAEETSLHTHVDALLVRTGKADCLLIAAFFHDIGKGLGGKHAEKGALITERLAPKMGFNTEETALIVWLVRYHLLLSDLSLRRDILDPSTVHSLIEHAQDQQHLDLLYGLTAADIRGASNKSWTEWKASVIARLYERAVDLLNPEPSTQDRMQRKRVATQNLRDALPEFDEEVLQKHLHNCTGDYLINTELDLQVLHARMVINATLANKRDSIIRTFPDTESAIVQLVIFTQEYSGLIGHTLAVLSSKKYSIVTMKIYPFGNSNVLFTVWFHQKGKAIDERRQLDRLGKSLEETIQARYFDTNTLPERDDPELFTGVNTKITINNNASRRATVIEVQTRNRSRLLFDLTRAFNQSKVRIYAAKIDTVGQRAIDVFYVLNRFGLKIYNQDHLNQIHKNLIHHINKGD